MHVGPSLTQKLHDALLRFRQDPVAVVADISKAFHRILIDEEHRKYAKFLWVDVRRDNQTTYQFKVVIFGACSSPYVLQQVLFTHLSNPNLEIQDLAQQFYVDNFFKTYSSVEVAIFEKPVIDHILEDASMPLQGWTSNSREFTNHFSLVEPVQQHMLGMKWDTERDSLSVVISKKFPFNLGEWKPTKRNFLAALASVFDPLGLVGPVTVTAKLFIQHLWAKKLSWDEILSVGDQELARKLLSELDKINLFSVPRYIINSNSSLQVFVDASSRAYGAAAYVYSSHSSHLLVSKQRVAPCNKSKLTIPKLELTAVLIGCRLIRHLLQLFKFVKVGLWTDSKVTISWVTSSKDLKDIYVSNRVFEIRNLIENHNIQLGYVNTKLNPADLLSRGCTVDFLKQSSLWKHGPPLGEVEIVENYISVSTFEIIAEIHPHPPSTPLLPLDNIHTYRQAHNIISRVITFAKLTRTPLEILSLQEQKLHTPTLYAYVKQPHIQVTPDIKQTAQQLNLVLINNTLRCYTRIQHSDLNEHTHTPLFIPRTSKLVTLFVLHLHNKYRHCSVTQTLTYYRQHAWTPKLRPVISLLLHRCQVCNILRRRTLPRPPPPVLPEERVRYVRPFDVVGIDNTGSYQVRGTLEGRRYLTLFVCTSTRNVHIEVTTSLSTADFIHALRRFSALYGVPSTILSDNGRNFLGARRSLAEAQRNKEFQTYLQDHEIKWKFQTPRSPWKGGHFERLVSIIKSSLVVSLRNKHLNEEEFRTAVAEAQAVVNSRPLTYLSNEVDDEALTPSHLLRGTLIRTLPLAEVVDDENPARSVRHQHTLLLQAIRSFHDRWKREYLTSLQQRHYASCIHSPAHQPQAGDLILLKQFDAARHTWPLAKIVEVYPDPEGVIRSALVKCEGEEYLRSVEHLVPLELSCETDEHRSADCLRNSLRDTDASESHEVATATTVESREEEEAPPVSTRSTPTPSTSSTQPSSERPDSSPSKSGKAVRRAAARSRLLLKELLKEGVV